VCYEAWEPYIFVNDQGQISGIDYDLLSAAAKYLGYTVTYNKQPYKRCLAEARAGRADIVLSISKGKPGTLQSSVVSAYWILAAIVPANSPLETPVSLENLRGKRVLLIDGYIYPPKLRQWFADNSHIIYANYGADDSSLIPFRMLEFKRADVFIEDLPWSRKFISDNDLKLRVLAPPLAIVPNYMGFRKGRAELRDQIDDFLARQGQGFRDELFLKYRGQPEATFSGN
jgi:ABC-type amino acid transport substrate-binding protein